MGVLAIWNPISGEGSAADLFESAVRPVLESAGVAVQKAAGTDREGHAGEIIRDFLAATEDDVLTLILLSGDGTLHEIINFLSTKLDVTKRPKGYHLVLVPCGTANALYSSLFPPTDGGLEYKLQSVRAFVKGGSKPVALNLSITTLSYPPSLKKSPEVAISSVVTSTSLHANILNSSESLRSQHPGLERFKIAAQLNASKWYSAHLKLLPPQHGSVLLYDPEPKEFITHPELEEEDDILDVYGPFAYFLSTVNVDRLEPKFRITPLAKRIPSTESATYDIVIVRPFQDPTIEVDSPEEREKFVAKIWKIMGGAYEDGKHVELTYKEDGEIVEGGDGPPVVEYVRCSGWEWVPDDEDEAAHILCSDGAIYQIQKNGRAVSHAVRPDDDHAGFMVYV